MGMDTRGRGFIRASAGVDTRWVVEGVGGLMVPLSGEALVTDLIGRLDLPVLIASSTRLGTINHTLMTAHVLRSKGLRRLGIVLIGPEDPSALTGISAHADMPILGRLPIVDPLTPAALRAEGQGLLSASPVLRAALKAAS